MTGGTEISEDVQVLLNLDQSELELELGRRLQQTFKELEEGVPLTAAQPAGPTVDRAVLQSVPEVARVMAERFLRRFNRQMYLLVCDATDPDHGKIRSAAAQGAEALGYALSGALVVTFGWLPGIATVIAVIIAKRAARSGYEAFCETWKEQL